MGLALLLGLILIPFVLLDDELARHAQLLTEYRPRWVLALGVVGMLAVDVVLPIPSSVVSTAAGTLLGGMAGALASTAGMTLGCALGWALGRMAGRTGARRLVGEAELARAEALARRVGGAAVVLSRPVPMLAEATAILAGTCRMPLGRFLGLALLANAGLSAVYAGIGAQLGAGASSAPPFLVAFAGAVALPALGLAITRLAAHRRPSQRSSHRPGGARG